MTRFSRCVLTLLLWGLCQFTVKASLPLSKYAKTLSAETTKVVALTGNTDGSVAAPVFQPAACDFSTPLAVEIAAEENSTIYYTTDGSVPTVNELLKYTDPIVVSSTTTVKAIAVDLNGNISSVATATYICTRHGIGEGYDPVSPGNPGEGGSAEKTYHLNVVCNPSGAGSARAYSYDLQAGAQTRVYAYNNNTGFVFKNWTIEDKEVSASSSFYYVMPEYDVTIVANYEYNPQSPGNPSPEEQKVKHPVVIRAVPSIAADFRPSGTFTMEEGVTRQVYAYPNTGWKLTGWIINGEQQSQTSSPLSITMGEKALDIAAFFTYDPSSPSNPAANYYNPTTGQVIVDDFTPGYLYNALNSLIGHSNFSNISSLIVKGQMTSNDLGNMNYFSNAETIDLSRVGGITSISSYTFESCSAASIILPSTVTYIGNYAFRNCSNLSSLMVYAQVPPACNSSTFSGFTNKANCTLFVPASAIELYSNAEYWKDFIILPISNDAHVLQVNLPAEAADGRYKHNSLEIVNISSGVRQKYVISDRMLYTFNGLQKDEQYNIYMYSQAGLEIGRIENVIIPDQDIEVTFDNLKSLHTVFAKVLGSDGADVTSQVSVEWLKPLADGTVTYLRKAVSLGEIPDGQQLICRVTLDNKLGVLFANPEDVEFTVSADANTCTVNLVPFRTVGLSGSVVDGDGAALSGASVSVNQTLNGKYSKTYTAKTDRKGLWSVSVLDAPETRLTYAATECVNVNDTIGAFAADVTTVDLGKTTLKSIVGARVTYGFTYHAAGSEDIQDYYSDYQNVAVSVFNVTQNRAHSEVSLQYPVLAVLDENINVGDELKLTATSKTGAFKSIVESVTIGEDQRAEVTFDVVGKGGISATFEMTENPAVTAMLYGSNGELQKKISYSEAKAQFTGLEDGDYTLITMGQSDLMNSILRLSSFSEIGLTEGKDYVKNTVTVESGKLTEIKISEVPAFDESLFYYTNSATSFSANKSSITTGNYLTLRSAIDFKGVYKNDISNVALVVDLPEACDFVEQSVIQGPNLMPYTLDNKRLTVQLGNNYQSQVRFCVVPTAGGLLNATASVVFDYKGKTVTQPIGSAASAIKDIEITVPSVVAETSFKASGVALGYSDVKIFENGVLLGQGKANAAGTWRVDCELTNPYNLSTHSVYAEITTPVGNTLTSESKNLTYDRNAIQVSKVTMINTAHPATSLNLCEYVTVFDFMNPKAQEPYWYWPSYPKFTFLVEFTTNNPGNILNVVLYVHTSSGKVIPLIPNFDDVKGCWIAQADFESSSLPVNVSLDFDADVNNVVSRRQLSEPVFDYSNNALDISAIEASFDDLEAMECHLTNEEYECLFNELSKCYDAPSVPVDPEISLDEVLKRIPNLLENSQNVREEIFPTVEALSNMSKFNSFDLNDYGIDGRLAIESISSVNIEDLLGEGYNRIEVDDASELYELTTEGKIVILDILQSTRYVLDYNSGNTSVKYAKAKGLGIDVLKQKVDEFNEKFGGFLDISSKINEMVSFIPSFFEGKIAKIDLAIAENRSSYKALQYYEGMSSDPSVNEDLSKQISDLKKENRALGKERAKLLKNKEATMKAIGKVTGVLSAFFDAYSAGSNASSYIDLWHSVPYCGCIPEKTKKLQDEILNAGLRCAGKDLANIVGDMVAIHLIFDGAAAAVPSAGTSLVLSVAGIGLSAIKGVINIWSDREFGKERARFQNRVVALGKDQSCSKCEDPTPNPDNPQIPPKRPNNGNNNSGGSHQSGCPNTDYVMDPSGFVYEAVPDNRVEGVQASIYYKEAKEDMYGDPYEEVVLWNAEEYAQKNPLFTDENGMYRWDVPKGLWQVKFEKEGYETAYSEWLPVPPPQLEVNVGIVQNKQPEVTEARAYEEGVEVQFDKFMDQSTLTTDNIYVTANGEKLKGEIRLIDSSIADEYASEDDADATRYTSRVRFVPEEKLSTTTGEIRVTVSRNVLSYAGKPMTETFSQTLDVEKEVKAITADDMKVLYGGEKEVTVYALPYEAAVGRKLHVANSSDLIASIDVTEAILDDEGKAVVTVKGDLPGRAQLTFTIDDVTTTGECAVDVVTEIITAEAPKASRASGTAVYRGSKVELTTDAKNATIYFTTDGSCPCDENGTRRKYTVPIIIDDDTRILAMTSVGTNDEDVSEVVEFNYTLKHTDMDFQLEKGWTWISHNLAGAVAPSELADDEGIFRMQGQTKELIRDPQMGMVGALTELLANESYKIETTSATTRKRLSDIAWNPATPIALKSGWNWLGYPVGQTMSVNEAFATTKAEMLDVVVGQNGFAQFDGENWIGTLGTMSPGMGYMYQSQSEKNVIYNTSIVSTASAMHAFRISDKSPLVLDIHKYGTIMPVVATINAADDSHLNNKDYQVAAFCGTECRGIGRVVNGLVMMNVYGNVNDRITFQVTDAEGISDFSNSASLNFRETVIGSIFNPYAISIDNATGIANVNYNGGVKVYVEDGMLRVKGIAANDINLVEVYDINGQKLISRSHVSESGISISTLIGGVYVVIVNGKGEYTYHKIVVQ